MRLRDLKNDSIRLSAVNLLTTAAPHLKVLTEISSGLNVTETTEFKDCIDDDEKDMCNVMPHSPLATSAITSFCAPV
ncbi:hypothetical protein C8F01DRAFT_1031995 [Mycena amicta]|nr:hypothetical protein C8F01DRAFT_1031995 [Mycena amicta]